ncbi:MAG TPA: SpoIID/LytB domain-containing protein [Acidimicrobiia bacterium]|nr:SpoIID/LytB domain-containing protein [Acidimicrobiia bacterium]
MRARPRLVFVALVAGALAAWGPSAQAKGGSSSAKKPTSATKAPKVPALAADLARIEPLPLTGGAGASTVALSGVGEYRGLLEVRRAAGGVGAVNEVALDDYLKGISEMPSGWPAEALRAQAIAARTYLLWVLGNGPAGEATALGAQICATESCQVYSGVAKEEAPNGDKWVAAVRDTAGLALFSGGAPILAKYSACNGGRSVSGGKPYLKAVDDPDDARCPLYRWGLSVSYDDVGRALAAPGTVTAVRATAGDVVVDWAGDGGGGRLTVPRTEFRAKVGAAVPPPPDRSRTVPSILFTLRADDSARVATLDGRGFGHGIGMSQWGAYGKAQRGMKAGAILAAYYGGVQPTRVPAAKLPARVRVAVEDGKPAPPPGPKPATGDGKPGSVSDSQGTPAGGKAAARPGTVPPAVGIQEAVVSASGPFRILDSKGNVIVPVATGTWKITAAAKGVRLLPPRDQAGAPGLTVLGVEPAAALPGQPLTVRFRSNLPAIVSATAQPPGGPAAPALAPQVAGTDERRVTLPAATRPGPYSLTLTADAGPGRTATLTVAPAVADPNAPPPAPAGGLLGPLPDVGLIDGGLAQTLIAAPPDATTANERPAPPARASRSAAVRQLGSFPSPTAPVTSDHGGLGLFLASLSGFALWRFRARG